MCSSITLIAIVLLLAVSTVSAQQPITVVPNTIPPFKYVKDGEKQGLFIEILDAIMQKAGTPIEAKYIKLTSWNRAFEETRWRANTITISMVKTKEREPLFTWVGPAYTFNNGIITPKDNEYEIKSTEDLFRFVIGTQSGTAQEKLLYKLGYPKNNGIRVTELKNTIHLLTNIRAQLLAQVIEPTWHTMREMGINMND